MGKTGLRGLPGEALGASHAPSWSPWRSLLPAFAISLLAHLFVLLGVHVEREAHAPLPVLVVTLKSATVLPSAPTSQRAAPPPPAAAEPPAPAPQPTNPPAAKAPVAAAPVAPVASAPSVPQREPESAPPPPDNRFHPAEELAQAPLPQGDPELRELAPQLVGRRLQVTVWIDATGAVQQAEVRRNELSAELVTLLQQAIAQVRFTPGRLQQEPAAAELRTMLCFDDAGLLDASSDECWKPQAAPAR